MQNEIQIFKNPVFGEIRTIVHEDGTFDVVVKDVLERLEYSDISNIGTIIQHVPEEWKGRRPIPTPGGNQEMLTLTEQGLYFFLARSDKPLALPFQKWIAGEVLPSIRRTGSYHAGQQADPHNVRHPGGGQIFVDMQNQQVIVDGVCYKIPNGQPVVIHTGQRRPKPYLWDSQLTDYARREAKMRGMTMREFMDRIVKRYADEIRPDFIQNLLFN